MSMTQKQMQPRMYQICYIHGIDAKIEDLYIVFSYLQSVIDMYCNS